MIVEQYPAAVQASGVAIGDTGITLRTDLAYELDVDDPGLVRFAVVQDADSPTIILEVPLGDAVAFWQPYGHWGRTTLPPDWRGEAHTSLIRSIPMGCLYAHDGRSLLGFALGETTRRVRIRYGVSEESRTFVVCLDLLGPQHERTLDLRVSAGGRSDETILLLRDWLTERSARRPGRAPAAARQPVYSTWYAYHHGVDAETLETDAAIAADLGFGSLFLDFGWQRHGVGRQFEGCGDWTPDPVKFPEFAGFVRTLHARGLAVVAWVAPFLLGERSDAFAQLSMFAPHHDDVLDAWILDPRHRVVRDSVITQFVDLVVANDLDGLKIDFLETATVYEGTPSTGDIAEVHDAVYALLTDLEARLAAVGKGDIIMEFRQPYVSPDLGRFANVVRAEDCPGDAVLNRTSIIDARLSTRQIVHSDMMMWHPSTSPEAIARHLHSSLFAVPQVSVPLSALDAAQTGALRAWLALWATVSDVTLDGDLRAEQPHSNHPTLTATTPEAAVVTVYEPDVVVAVPAAPTVVIVNATSRTRLVLQLPDGGPWRARTVDATGRVDDAGLLSDGGPVSVTVPASGRLDLETSAASERV